MVDINDDIDTPAQNLPPVELELSTEAEIEIEPDVTSASIEAPALQRSTRFRTHTKQDYAPRMTGKIYIYASTQLDMYCTTKYDFSMIQMSDQGMINLDAHMFVQQDLY